MATYAVLGAAYAALLTYDVGVVGLLLARDKFHRTARLLFWAVVMGFVGTWLSLIHYAALGRDGRGAPRLVAAATFFYLVSDALVLLLLVLCAKGWNIVRRKLGVWTRVP